MSFRRRADAEEYRGKLFAAWQKQEPSPLSPHESADAAAALRVLAEAGVALSLQETIRQALPLLSRARAVTVEGLLAEFAELKEPHWSALSTRNFRAAARRFVEAFGDRDPAALSAQELTVWLNAEYPSAASRAHAMRTLNPAFTYALRQKHITENPFALVEKQRVVKQRAIDVLSPEEVRALLNAAPADCVPAYAMMLFAGVRPYELRRLRWGNVRDGFLHVEHSVAKTRSARNIELHPTLVAWLEAFRPAGADAFSAIVPTDWHRKDQAARAAAGVANRPDVCRHSYASYYLAAYGSADKLKANMGHSRGSDTLFVHYRAATTPEVAERFWGILPEVRGACLGS